jgi:hypothetical protein
LKTRKLKKLEDVNSNKEAIEDVTTNQNVENVETITKDKQQPNIENEHDQIEKVEIDENRVKEETASNLQCDEKELGVDQIVEINKSDIEEERKSDQQIEEKMNKVKDDKSESEEDETLNSKEAMPVKNSVDEEQSSNQETSENKVNVDSLSNLESHKTNDNETQESNIGTDKSKEDEYHELTVGADENSYNQNQDSSEDNLDEASNLELVTNNNKEEQELNHETVNNNGETESKLEADEIEHSEDETDDYEDIQVDEEISFRLSRKRKRSDDSFDDNSNCKRRKMSSVKYHQLEPKLELELLSHSDIQTTDDQTQLATSIKDGEDLLMKLFNRECHQFLEKVFLTLTKSEIRSCQNVSSELSSLVTFYCGPKVSQIQRVLARNLRNQEWKTDYFPEMDAIPDDKTLEEYFIQICRP